MHNTSLSQRMPSHYASTATHAEYFVLSVSSLLNPWFLPVSVTLLELMAHPSNARFTRSLEIYLYIGLKATPPGRAKIHELLDLLCVEQGGGVSVKTSQTVFGMGEPRTPRRLAYVMHDEGMRDRAAGLEVTARRETRALVSLQEIA
eukprot:3821458-Pleurochrysis_carterae.AAC.1